MNEQMDIFTDDGSADGRAPQDGFSRPEANDHGASARWLWPATREHGSAVLLGTADQMEIERSRFLGERRRRPDPLPRNQVNQDVLAGWVSLLGPHFDGDSVNLTGTYSDGYGYSHGLMLPRNVMRDFARAIEHERPGVFLPRCIGVEEHNTGRAVLHFHAMVGGVWSDDDRARLEAYWLFSRGWAKAKAVSASGGCVGYCAKHLLKRGAADNFDFQLAPRRAFLSRHDKRVLDSAR